MPTPTSRRAFLKHTALGAAALAAPAHPLWLPKVRRRLRVGIVGHGVCRFGAQFSFQHHPDVEVVAVSDLFEDRCRELAALCRAPRSYPSLDELLQDDAVEAVFLATDAPSHAQHSIDALRRGKHVACAVPAIFGDLEQADALLEAVRTTGLTYMMFETSCFRPDLYAMRRLYDAGALGALVHAEGEYYHDGCARLPSHRDWRRGLPPQWYPTHSNAYYVGVTGRSFVEVSCMGMPSARPELQADGNAYRNPFGTEVALFRTAEGGSARMAVSWDTPGHEGEVGRVRGQRGSVTGTRYQGAERDLPDLDRPPLPEGVEPGGHGGSHGHLGHEFVRAVLDGRRPLVDVAAALNMTVPGIVAHRSALRDGELLKIPQYAL
jgi:predicted dehydrogenase